MEVKSDKKRFAIAAVASGIIAAEASYKVDLTMSTTVLVFVGMTVGFFTISKLSRMYYSS